MVQISANADEQLAWLVEDIELGFEQLFLHNVNRHRQRFIDDFGEKALPSLLKAA